MKKGGPYLSIEEHKQAARLLQQAEHIIEQLYALVDGKVTNSSDVKPWRVRNAIWVTRGNLEDELRRRHSPWSATEKEREQYDAIYKRDRDTTGAGDAPLADA
jgi:hypothetical protein